MSRGGSPDPPRAAKGDRFGSRVELSEADVGRFARSSGDENPLHHDRDYASSTRFGGLLASGPHTSALLMGCTASHFSRTGPMLGLDFAFRFKKPVLANQTVTIEWLVVDVRASARLGGALVELRGRMRDAGGTTVVGASGRVLLCDDL